MIKESLLLLNRVKFSPSKVKKILSFFSEPEEILKATRSDLRNLAFLSEGEISRLLSLRDSHNIERDLEIITKERIQILDIFSPDYPSLLKEIDYPPLLLYIKG